MPLLLKNYQGNLYNDRQIVTEILLIYKKHVALMAQPNPCGTTLQSSNHRAYKSLATGARDKPEPSLNNNTRSLCPAVSCFYVIVKCHICKYLSLFKMLNQTKLAQIMQLLWLKEESSD